MSSTVGVVCRAAFCAGAPNRPSVMNTARSAPFAAAYALEKGDLVARNDPIRLVPLHLHGNRRGEHVAQGCSTNAVDPLIAGPADPSQLEAVDARNTYRQNSSNASGESR